MLELLRARRQPSPCGLYCEQAFHPYEEILATAARQAAALTPGTVVVLVGENSLELVQALLAAWWAGCTPVCLPPPARLQQAGPYQDFLRSCLEHVGATGGWCDARLEKRLPGQWRSLPLPTAETETGPGPEAACAYIQFSSGTTLEPRATRLSHANLAHNLEAIARQLPGDRTRHSCVSWLPLYHDMGLVGCLLSALYAPGSLSLLTPLQFALRPDSWLQTLSQRRASISVAPNFALEQLLQRGTTQHLDLSCLQMLLLGSETIRPETLREFHAKYAGCGLAWEALRPVYGLAENTLAVTFSAGPRLLGFCLPGEIGGQVTTGTRQLVSLGQPVEGVQVSIGDEQGQPLPAGSLGSIQVAGPSLAADLNSPYDTGDLGFFWEEELYFVTRRKDVLVHHARKHDPEVVEQLVLPFESAAVQQEHGAVCLIERPRRGPVPKLDELQRRLSTAPLPVRAELVDSGWLPRTSSGKISRFRARKKWDVSL
ncbi:MAG: AMP-binding protein [Candidatus Eremiobacteraeota bacterium]|nr:AMP-binding protein [Candidatus Eremiobacteraeota bacterium]MCW5870970.1 AMP-binding protein [Candidatus Eremiobacteraeota bacterium]